MLHNERRIKQQRARMVYASTHYTDCSWFICCSFVYTPWHQALFFCINLWFSIKHSLFQPSSQGYFLPLSLISVSWFFFLSFTLCFPVFRSLVAKKVDAERLTLCVGFDENYPRMFSPFSVFCTIPKMSPLWVSKQTKKRYRNTRIKKKLRWCCCRSFDLFHDSLSRVIWSSLDIMPWKHSIFHGSACGSHIIFLGAGLLD